MGHSLFYAFVLFVAAHWDLLCGSNSIAAHWDLLCGSNSMEDTKTGPVIFCWLGGFDIIRMRENRLRLQLSKMCQSAAVVEALEGASACKALGTNESCGILVGAVKLQIRVVCHTMLKVSPHEHEQIAFWESTCSLSLLALVTFLMCLTCLRCRNQ